MPDTVLDQAEEFNLPDALAVVAGGGELPCVQIDTPACTARQYLLGATVTDWQPAGHDPVLFTADHAVFREGKGIRGGVPVCFPWFSDHPTDPNAPAHGLVRAKPWHLTQTALGPDGVDVEMVTNLDQLRAELRTTFGPNLTVRLIVTNTSDTDQTFESALHTYLTLGDIHQASVTGLEHAEYVDHLQSQERLNQGDAPITFTAETDRVYQNTPATCVLHDPAMKRKITVEKLGSLSTVVWNPWIDKSKRLSDFGDDEYLGMCCIETANIAEHAVTLAPGEAHTTLVKIGVEKTG
ncbi:MAG: D-hexose-6-phosphate mutarotase [Planctomycetota bacterium]